jgi:RNA polymerase sigma factor (sigma-70 family)
VNDQTDSQLLRAYAELCSEAAFAELVRRHVDLVYSAALRMVCDSSLAEDVTQAVFLALAHNAAQLTDRPVLSGWLHRTAQNIAAQTVRTDVRRRSREQEAAAMNELLSAEPDAVWDNIAPHLDAALGELSEADRDALLMRYFERKSAREMAQTLGVSDEAAQKRVSRAVERLREFFAKRGLTVGASGLVAVISANAVQAAPVGLALAISTAAALAGSAVATTATATATKAMVMTTLQKTLIAATLAAAVGTGIYEAHQVSKLQTQVETLQQQQAPLTEQIQQLRSERDETTRQLGYLRDENERLNRNTGELLRLRGEVSLLRRAQDTAGTSANSSGSPAPTTSSQEQAAADIGRELGLSVVRGDAGALEKVAELSKASLKSFNSKRVGLDDTQRGELSARTFASIQAAFDVIGEAAVEGNAVAIAAVERALQIQELKGLAVPIVGTLAGKGNEAALEMLLNPDKYGILLSSSVFALRSAAEGGNQRAIDALAAVAKDGRSQALWYEIANVLATVAESGNAVAVDALVAMSVATNQQVRNAVVSGLQRASANQSAKATETLRAMGVP